MRVLFGLLGVLVVIGFFIWLPFQVWPIETSRGEHTGYVTAIERNGLFFHKATAYVKTDTQSSQEDTYCVLDAEVFSQLQEFASRKAHVDLYYFNWLKRGIQNCKVADNAIIYKVVEIK